MKAKLYIFDEKFEIKLSDDTIIAPKAKETKEKFLERIKALVNTEYLDDEFEVIEIDAEVVASNDTKTLKAALEGGATGLQKKLIEAALATTSEKAVKEKKSTVVARSAEEAKASEEYKAAEANIGKFASFSPFKSLEVIEGKIAGVALNKTNTILYYTIVEASGKRRCCGVLNETVAFIEQPEGFEKAAPVKTEKATKTPKAAKAKEVVGATDANDTDLDGNVAGGDLM